MENIVCSSTKNKITNDIGSTRFKCPNCGEYEIIRSKKARELAIKYTCPGCGFEGPN
jgi:Zn-ribbon RNA-binding protein